MYIFSHNKCHQAEFQFFIFWRTSCRLESSGWLAFPKRLRLGKWRRRRGCGELTMVHKSSKEFLCRATRDAGSWSTNIHLSHCSCHSSMHFFHFSWEFLFSGQLVLVRPETQKVSHFSRGPQSARLGLRWQEVGGWVVGTQVTSMVGCPTVHHLAQQQKQHTGRLLLLLDRDHLLLLLIILLSANPQATWWTLACCPQSNNPLQLMTLPLEGQSLVCQEKEIEEILRPLSTWLSRPGLLTSGC